MFVHLEIPFLFLLESLVPVELVVGALVFSTMFQYLFQLDCLD